MTESGWRPIETAPRDGTDVLLFIRYPDGETVTTIAAWEPERHDVALKWPWNSIDGCGYPSEYAANWMPLPEPPEAK